MSTTAKSRRPPTQRPNRAVRRRTRGGRRRLAMLVAVLVAGVGAALLISRIGGVDDAVRELQLPLRHDDIIRQQGADKDLDPALIAAVIYQESGFRPRTSPVGAEGLMQIMPDTARFIARRSGGTAFELEDLDTPQINIAYGSWYLRYLLDHYDGEERLALAAYNAGLANVDAWAERAGGRDALSQEEIPFPETRNYVEGVLEVRARYRERYASELGL